MLHPNEPGPQGGRPGRDTRAVPMEAEEQLQVWEPGGGKPRCSGAPALGSHDTRSLYSALAARSHLAGMGIGTLASPEQEQGRPPEARAQRLVCQGGRWDSRPVSLPVATTVKNTERGLTNSCPALLQIHTQDQAVMTRSVAPVDWEQLLDRTSAPDDRDRDRDREELGLNILACKPIGVPPFIVLCVSL